MPFFDYPDEHFEMVDLWRLSNVALTLLDLFYRVNLTCNALVLVDTFKDTMRVLIDRTAEFKLELDQRTAERKQSLSSLGKPE